ncbi:NAD(P)-dependent oxidoreductase [Curvibacter sp. PAE-UM]|uniref:NAD(P)-dependent oxidoreductase n=1 Tax=Curvibacter sp. PAE-UM TaxID=1714344 RepID=UPI00070C255A|nr:NAD(P)-dependent oxidoreductase [Curvibacter sp. PAE-UM]KRH99099.1 GDP-mannose dehydrogenase [Curvibacter sp. PAE-UM]
MKIHFIGVGKMGLPMAGHLAAAGHTLTVSDPCEERCELAQEQGLAVVSDASAAIAAADAVFSSLPHDAALRAVAAQVAAAARPGTVYVDTSTVSQQASTDAAQALEGKGLAYLRTTVSGNNKMAEAAQLTVLVSGPRVAYDQMLPLLKALGPNHFYLGEAEQARLMKLVVNLMIAQTSAMLAEALTLGRKGGLDWQAMWEVLTASAVASPIVKAKSAQLSRRDFTPTFTVEQMIKDLDLILAAGAASNVPLMQTAMTQKLMHAAVVQGNGLDDYAAIIKVLERGAGLNPKL